MNDEVARLNISNKPKTEKRLASCLTSLKTPLLLMCGEQDHNVPPRLLMEMYYALRRLGKEVECVSHTNGGHGMPTTTVDEVRDYHKRIMTRT